MGGIVIKLKNDNYGISVQVNDENTYRGGRETDALIAILIILGIVIPPQRKRILDYLNARYGAADE